MVVGTKHVLSYNYHLRRKLQHVYSKSNIIINIIEVTIEVIVTIFIIVTIIIMVTIIIIEVIIIVTMIPDPHYLIR